MSAHERASLLASGATDTASVSVVARAHHRRDVLNTIATSPSSSTRRGAWDRLDKAAVVVASVLGILGVVSLHQGATPAPSAVGARLGGVDLHTKLLRVHHDLQGKSAGHGLPVYLHIPKTGGTTIESSLGVLGINVGYCDKRPNGEVFKLHEKYSGWEKWHCIPKESVPNSWTIVRNPYTKAESEFLYNDGSYEPTVFYKLRPGYAKENCELFEAHVKKMIEGLVHSEVRQCYDDGDYKMGVQNKCDEKFRFGVNSLSHWYPQMLMASRAQRIFRVEDCFGDKPGTCRMVRLGKKTDDKQNNIITFLRHNYHGLVEMVHANEWNKKVGKPELHQCWARMDRETLANFNRVYRADFDLLGYACAHSISRSPNATSSELYAERLNDSTLTLGDIEAALKAQGGGRIAVNDPPHCADVAKLLAKELAAEEST